MTTMTNGPVALRWGLLRTAGWVFGAALLLTPLIAMQFTHEVNWTAFDFFVAAVLIGGAGLGLEAFARASNTAAYRLGALATVGGLFFLVWVNLAVGIVGTERNPANLMYAGVIAVAVGGATIAHRRPRGMAWTMLATAAAQTLVLVAARGAEIQALALNACFVALWLGAAWLFARAARQP